MELFRRSLSPLEAKVFDRYGAIDAALADDLATTRDTVKSTRQRIRSKAKKWSTTGSTSTGAVAA